MPHALAEIAHRDAGLRRAIGPWGMAAITGNILMGSGFYVVPGEMARLGPYAPLGMIACGLAVGAVLLCLAEGSSRVPTSGGIYGFVDAAFGSVAGATVGGLTWVMVTFAAAAVLAASADQAARLLPWFGGGAGRAAYVIAACAAFAVIASGGARRSARALEGLVLLKLFFLLLFLVVAVFVLPPVVAAASAAPVGIGKSLLLGVFLFMGAESALSVSGEVDRPARSIPLGVLGAMAVYAMFGATVQWAVWRAGGAGVIGSTAPLADIMAQLSPGLTAAVVGGAMVATLGCVAGMIVCAPRILFAYARDGVLPAGLGRLNESHAPVRAIWFNSAIIAALSLSGGYVALASLATLAGIGIYISGALAALRLRARSVALAGTPMRFKFMPLAAAIGIGAMLAVGATASWRELAVTAAVVTALAALARARAPSA